jgi:hypothetical protein
MGAAESYRIVNLRYATGFTDDLGIEEGDLVEFKGRGIVKRPVATVVESGESIVLFTIDVKAGETTAILDRPAG